MPSEIFTNASVIISTSTAVGSNDLSNRVMKLVLTREGDEHDDTVMGLTAHSRIIGLEKWSFKTDMIQSFSTSDGGLNTNQLLNTLYSLRTSLNQKFMVTVRKDATAIRSTSNPEWSGLCVLKGYDPINGGVGDLLKSSVEFLGSGNLSQVTTSS